MTENLNEVNREVKERKAFRKGYFFLAFIPFAILMVVQTAVTVPCMILAVIDISKGGSPYDMKQLMQIFNSKYGLWCYIIYCLVCIAIFIPWYLKGFVKKQPKVIYKKALGFRPVVLSFAVMICMYFVVCGVFTAIDKLFPDLMQAYNELMEISSFGSNLWITIVYGIILGPVTEELCYRGLIIGMFEKTGMNFMIVILIQGVLFGFMHMNVVQGIYAFLLGFVLGYLKYRYKTVLITIAAHAVFNTFGTLVSVFLTNIGETDETQMIAGAIASAVTVVLFIAIVNDKGSYTEGRDIPQAMT